MKSISAVAMVAIFLSLQASPIRAYKRLVEDKGALARPVFGVLAGVGAYEPVSGLSGSSLMFSTGLRYVRPDPADSCLHSLWVEGTINSSSTSTEDVFIWDVGVLPCYRRTSVFTFDHHFFWGGGIGLATVTRPKTADLRLPIGYLAAGLQGRVRDWYLEARVKLLLGQRRSAFDSSSAVPQLVATYHFNP